MFSVKIEGNEYQLAEGITVIGRSKDSDIKIDSPKLSRAHARFIVEGAVISIEDLNSRNGTFVNGKKLKDKKELSKGDKVRIGDIDCSIAFSETVKPAVDPEAQPVKSLSEERAEKLHRKKMISRIKAAAVLIVLVIGVIGIYSYLKNYIPEEQKMVRELLKETRNGLSSIELSHEIPKNLDMKKELGSMKEALKGIPARYKAEIREAGELIGQIDKKLQEIEVKNAAIQKELDAQSVFSSIEKDIKDTIGSLQKAVARLEDFKGTYAGTKAAENAGKKINELKKLIQEKEGKVFDEAYAHAENLGNRGQFSEAVSVINECMSREFTRTYQEEIDKLRSLKEHVFKRAKKYFMGLAEEAIEDAETGNGGTIKAGLENEYKKLGFTEFEKVFNDAVARIEQIRVQRIARARAMLEKDIGKIEGFERKRMYEKAAQLYSALIPKIDEPELREEIEKKKRLNNLRLIAKKGIIEFVNGQGGLEIQSVGKIQSMTSEKVMIEMEGLSAAIGWDKVRNNEFLVLLSRAVKKYPDPALFTALALFFIEKGRTDEADEYLAKALSGSSTIEPEYPGLFVEYRKRLEGLENERKQFEQDRRKKLAEAALAEKRGRMSHGKFIQTFMVMLRGGPKLMPDDVETLAKFDIIMLNRHRYNEIKGNTWRAIKAVSPDTEIFLQTEGPTVWREQDDDDPRMCKGFGRYNNPKGHPMGSVNKDHEDFFLYTKDDRKGKRCEAYLMTGYKNRFLMDIGLSQYHEYWIKAFELDIVKRPWVADGIHIDNTGPILTFSTEKPAKYMNSGKWSTRRWADAMNSFVKAVVEAFSGFGQKVWINAGGPVKKYTWEYFKELDNSPFPPDILGEEYAFLNPVGFMLEERWKNQVDFLSEIKNSRHAYFVNVHLGIDETGKDNYGQEYSFWQVMWYSMCSYLIGKDGKLNNAYFFLCGKESYNRLWWFDEYDHIDLGRALSTYRKNRYGSSNIYWREFDRGYVYVNPTPNDAPIIPLPIRCKELNHDNFKNDPNTIHDVNTIELKSHHGTILLKSGKR